jgi:hypothetical protein
MTTRSIALALTLVLVTAGCGATGSSDGGSDAAGRSPDLEAIADLAGAPTDLSGGLGGGPDLTSTSSLCATPACANTPCTPGCAFTVGPCTMGEQPVALATVKACPGFCGLFNNQGAVNAFGCLRYRVEDQACTPRCWQWGNATCFERAPSVDYSVGGAICDRAKAFTCYSPLPPPDAGGNGCGDMK